MRYDGPDMFFAERAPDGSHWRVKWRRTPQSRAPLRTLPGSWSQADVDSFFRSYGHGFEDGFDAGRAEGRRALQAELRGLLGAAKSEGM